MKTSTHGRRAVSPIIATLLLIAITVAAGVVVYVFVGGLSANLSKSGGNQVTEQLSMDAYNFQGTAISITVRNTGTGAITLSTIYFDGSSITPTSCAPVGLGTSLDVGSTTTCSYTTSQSAGTSHSVKFVTSDGALFTFNVIAGSTG